MYVPPHFKPEDHEEVMAFIREHSFATLVNLTEGRLWATHIPLELAADQEGNAILAGHISRANPQWRGFLEDSRVLAIFQGPHAYISPVWYNHENVPTWNYIAVHVYGSAKLLEGEDLYESLRQLIATHEQHTRTGLRIEDLPEEMVRRQMKGIAGFGIAIEEVQATHKLSQNRDEESYFSVIQHLQQLGDPQSVAVAREMKKRR